MNNDLISENWHTESAKTVFTSLGTTSKGISKEEACNRLAEHGPNRLPEPRMRGPLVRFFCQFRNILIYVLIAASAATAMLEHWVDAGVILINAVIGFVQEGKAEELYPSGY